MASFMVLDGFWFPLHTLQAQVAVTYGAQEEREHFNIQIFLLAFYTADAYNTVNKIAVTKCMENIAVIT